MRVSHAKSQRGNYRAGAELVIEDSGMGVVEVDERDFIKERGEIPSGVGTWMFLLSGLPEVFCNMDYEAAKRRVLARARARGYRGVVFLRP